MPLFSRGSSTEDSAPAIGCNWLLCSFFQFLTNIIYYRRHAFPFPVCYGALSAKLLFQKLYQLSFYFSSLCNELGNKG